MQTFGRNGSRQASIAWALALVLIVVASCSRAPEKRVSEAPPPSSVPTAPSVTADGTFEGRTIAEPMGYQGADWLDRADREQTEQPDRVIDALHIAKGSTVADIGAGTGYFSRRLSAAVGPTGHVIATDIQPEMLALLRAKLDGGFSNIALVQCTADDAKLPPHALDLALMVDVYHELAHPAETLAQVRVALKDGGRLVLVEYRGEDPAVAIKPEHKMTLPQVRREVEAAKLRFTDSLEFLRDQRVIIFTKSE